MLSGVSTNKVVGRHLHKLVQVLVQTHLFLSSSSFFLFVCLFVLRSGFFFQVLGKSLYIGVSCSRGQGRVCDVEGQTKEHNTMLFNWYFKGFEFLRHYLIKHPSGVGLENLDMEVVNLEMASDEALQSTAPVKAVPGDTPLPPPVGDYAAAA